jgi:hypothetical protein
VHNLHQHIKNDTDSTDVVENDYMLIKAALFDFSTFNIHCPNLGILEQLKTLLNKLASYRFETD